MRKKNRFHTSYVVIIYIKKYLIYTYVNFFSRPENGNRDVYLKQVAQKYKFKSKNKVFSIKFLYSFKNHNFLNG